MQSFTRVSKLLHFLLAQEPQILFNVLNKLPKMGVGRKVTRVTWNLQDKKFLVRPVYWTVERVVPSEDLRSGEVWGTFCHRGTPQTKIRTIRSIERKQWILLPKDFDSKQLNEDDECDSEKMQSTSI